MNRLVMATVLAVVIIASIGCAAYVVLSDDSDYASSSLEGDWYSTTMYHVDDSI